MSIVSNNEKIPTSDDRELFNEIANDIKTNQKKYLEAGKWLDEYCSADAYWQREEKRLEELEQLARIRPNMPHNDQEIANLKEKLEKRGAVSLFKGFSGCRKCWEEKYEDEAFVSEPDAKIIILITWLLSDPDAGETEPSITELQKWGWEPTDDILSGSRSYVSTLWYQNNCAYGAWMKLVRIAWAKLEATRQDRAEHDKWTLAHIFLGNLLRTVVKHLPFVGSFLYDVIYGTLDSRASQKQRSPQPQSRQLSLSFQKQKAEHKAKGDSEKWYRNRTIQAALIGIVGTIIVVAARLYTSKPRDVARPDPNGEVSGQTMVSRSLREICEDIDSRPLLQQEATAKNYIGIKIEREQLKLFDIFEYTEDGTFQLIMILPDQSDVSYLVVTGRKIVCTVNKAQYPELTAAKKDLVLLVSGQIESAGSNYIQLSDVSLSFD